MRHSTETMYPLIERYLEGGQTQKAFSESHDISVAVLNYWISKYRRDQKSVSAFIEVKPPVAATFAELSFASGVQVRFLSPVSASYLLELLPQ